MIVRTRFRGPAMTLCDLADNVQAKAHTRMPFVCIAAPERLKKLLQGRSIDWGTAVAYLDANVSRLRRRRATRTGHPVPVMDCIGDEIPKQLLHAFPVPGTVAVAHDIQLQPAIRIGNAQLLQFLRADCPEIHLRWNDADPQTEIRSVEIDKVIEQSLQASTAANQPSRSSRDLRARIELSKI